jgi:hypothetical protein
MRIYSIRMHDHHSAELRAAVDAVNRQMNDSGDSTNYENVVREYDWITETFGLNSVWIDHDDVHPEEK